MSQQRPPGSTDRQPTPSTPGSVPPPTAADHLQLIPLHPRRQSPWLLVEVEDSPDGHRALVWALREAARREATVVAVAVIDVRDGDPRESASRWPSASRAARREHLEASVLRAIAETGISGRIRTATLERPVFEALDAAMHGADLVVVGAGGKRLLRPALPRPPFRRAARGA